MVIEQAATSGRSPTWIAPTYSRSRVDQAGRRIRTSSDTGEDRQVLENWRLSHAYVLNAFQVVLRRRCQPYAGTTFAQRHKRRSTIEDKLLRQPNMALSRMHDIAGCRLIFPNTTSLYHYRSELAASRWAHERTNGLDDFDYIKAPKSDGYRGVHDVYKYHSRAISSQPWDGMRIEIQFRTAVQHSWATAVEIADSLLRVGAKFGRASEAHIEFFCLVSELFALTIESDVVVRDTKKISDIRRRIKYLSSSTNIMPRLRGLTAAREQIEGYRHIVLEIDNASRELKLYRSKSLKAATDILVSRERTADIFRDVVLVSADSSQGLRSAFRNYFSDADEFIRNYDAAMIV